MSPPEVRTRMSDELVHIGKSIVIKGELSGSEDLTVEGEVEGKIELRDHVLTIGSNAKITAQVAAKAVVVLGHVRGNLSAAEKIDIRENGSVEGDVVAPRVAIADGAHFRGSIDMQRKETSSAASRPSAAAARSEAKSAAPVASPATGQLASA